MANVNLDIASNLGITCRKGDSFRLQLQITDANDVAIDTTAYSFDLDVVDVDTDTTVLEFTDSEFTKNVDGTLIVTKTAALMNAVAEGTYRYDLQSTRTSDSFVQTWLFGNFTVKQDFSR